MLGDVPYENGESEFVRVGVYDMSGNAAHSKLRPHAYQKADVVIICFSLTDGKYFTVDPDSKEKSNLSNNLKATPNQSFCNVKTVWLPEVMKTMKERKDKEIVKILVGCKSDKFV